MIPKLHRYWTDAKINFDGNGVYQELGIYFASIGLTIHFEGQLKNEAAYEQLLEKVSSIAKTEGWLSEAIESKVTALSRVRDEQDWDYVGPVKGIVISLAEDCDPVRLEFDSDLYMQEFTKTQFAGVQVHLKVLELLKAMGPFFRNLKVEDEGEYWETGNLQGLTEHMNRAQKAIEAELEKYPNGQMKVKTPSGRIMDLLT